MKKKKYVYEVWKTVDEYHSVCRATCDSLETALEFAKTIHDWFCCKSVYEQIMDQFGTVQNLKENLEKCYSIKKKELVTLDSIKENNDEEDY